MPSSRRAFLLGCAALAAGAMLPATRVLAQPRFAKNPFTLGVASGYPQPDGITLWTRLAPEPLAGGGMPPAPVEVEWELAADDGFRKIVRRGREIAAPEYAHSVHVDVPGLSPSRWYWYRFHAGGATSAAGKTRTTPAHDAVTERMRLAFASCQQYEQGYYAAYRHMAREDLDLVIHLGDYIYESSWGRNHVRSHGAGEPTTLAEYRNRYALYKSDPHLQAAHAEFPWLATWDDHEVDNDYANDRSQDLDPPEAFLARRAAAYQVYYEHMPLPASMQPRGAALRLYTRCTYGQLVEIDVLDTRQYRSYQACPRPGRGGGNVVAADACAERLDPQRTMLGTEQEKWLFDRLSQASARWNLIAQQTLMAQADRRPGEGQEFWTDGWDGYPAARQRLLKHIAEQRVPNPVVVGGDVHMAVVADLRVDFDQPRSPVVATEFVATSITSQGPSQKRVDAVLAENPHIKFANSTRRGYTVMALSQKRCIVRLRALNDVTDPDSRQRELAAYLVESGRPGAQPL
jgi:alkaline phosphatase D